MQNMHEGLKKNSYTWSSNFTPKQSLKTRRFMYKDIYHNVIYISEKPENDKYHKTGRYIMRHFNNEILCSHEKLSLNHMVKDSCYNVNKRQEIIYTV